MIVLKKIALTCAVGTLAACSSASDPAFVPAVSGSAANTAGAYSVTQNGVTRIQSGVGGTIGTDLRFWGGALGTNKAFAYENATVLAIAGMEAGSNITYAGLTGTAASSVPISGTAAYAGEFTATYYRGGGTNEPWNVYGDLTTNVDFGSGLLAGSGTGTANSSLSVSGTISGVNFNGVAMFDADDTSGPAVVPLTGGFYGTGTLAGIYQGTSVSGLFYGIAP